MIAKGRPIADKAEVGRGVLTGIKDNWIHKWLILRCSAIGCYVGFVPGMGTPTASWLAYGHAVQSAKDGGDFGKGDVRGVVAPEAANNAARGGELIPTLLFGVPGSASMALLLTALVMFGISPGPEMLTIHLDMVFEIVWALVLANVVCALLCLALAGYLAKVATAPIQYLAPLVIIILVMGAFQATQDWGDLVALISLGFLGWIMKQYGFGRPAALVGFVLGRLAERYLGLSIQRYGYEWIFHPWVIVIFLMIVFTIWSGMRWQKKQAQKDTELLSQDAKAMKEAYGEV